MIGTESDTAAQEIVQRNTTFETAFNNGDMQALAALYTEDAQVLPDGSPLTRGRPAIQQFWQGARDSGIRRVSLHTQEVKSTGDLAYEVGSANLDIGASEQQTTTVTVKYVVVWRRVAGGPWQMAVDIWNSDGAA